MLGDKWNIPEKKNCSVWRVFWGLEKRQSVVEAVMVGWIWIELGCHRDEWDHTLASWPEVTTRRWSCQWWGVTIMIVTVRMDLLAETPTLHLFILLTPSTSCYSAVVWLSLYLPRKGHLLQIGPGSHINTDWGGRAHQHAHCTGPITEYSAQLNDSSFTNPALIFLMQDLNQLPSHHRLTPPNSWSPPSKDLQQHRMCRFLSLSPTLGYKKSC